MTRYSGDRYLSRAIAGHMPSPPVRFEDRNDDRLAHNNMLDGYSNSYGARRPTIPGHFVPGMYPQMPPPGYPGPMARLDSRHSMAMENRYPAIHYGGAGVIRYPTSSPLSRYEAEFHNRNQLYEGQYGSDLSSNPAMSSRALSGANFNDRSDRQLAAPNDPYRYPSCYIECRVGNFKRALVISWSADNNSNDLLHLDQKNFDGVFKEYRKHVDAMHQNGNPEYLHLKFLLKPMDERKKKEIIESRLRSIKSVLGTVHVLISATCFDKSNCRMGSRLFDMRAAFDIAWLCEKLVRATGSTYDVEVLDSSGRAV